MPGTPRTPEAAGQHHYNPNYLPSAPGPIPPRNRLLLEAGGSANVINQNDTASQRFPRDERPRSSDQGLNLIYGNVAARTLPRRQYQERFAASYVTGSHNFKTGFWYRTSETAISRTRAATSGMHGTGVEYRFSTPRAQPDHARWMRHGISRRA